MKNTYMLLLFTAWPLSRKKLTFLTKIEWEWVALAKLLAH